MSDNLSEHARVARLIGLPQVARPKPPTPEPAPSSPAGSLFDGSDDEDAPKLDLENFKTEQTSATNQTSSPQPLRAPIPDLKDAFPKPDAGLPFGPPSTSSPATTQPQVSLEGSERPPAAMIMMNLHACEGQSVWTSSGGVPNIPEAVQARTTGTSVAQALAPYLPVLPASLQLPQPLPHPTPPPPPPTRREARRRTRPAQDTRHIRDAPAPETTMTTQGQGGGNTGAGGGRWAANGFEFVWEAPLNLPPHMMVMATGQSQVAAHTRGSGPQSNAGRAAPTPNPAPTPNAGAPITASQLVRTRTAPPATMPPPTQVPDPVPPPPTGHAAPPVRPLPSAHRAESIPTRPPPHPSTTMMQEAPRRVPLPQLTSGSRTFTPHQLSAIALARATSDSNFAMHLPPAARVPPHLLTQPYVAPLPLPTISGTTAQPGYSHMAYTAPNQMTYYNQGNQGVPVEKMRMPSAGPSSGSHHSTSHYTLYPQPVEPSATPTSSQIPRTVSQKASETSGFGGDGGFSAAAWMQGGSTPIQPPALSRSQTFNRLPTTGTSVSYFSGAYIPPPPMPGSALGQKRPADVMETMAGEVQGIQPPSQSAKRSKYTYE